MKIFITTDPYELGKAAGRAAAALIKQVIATKGSANIILATGTSQFETLKQLVSDEDLDWSKVVMFHLDEYIGLPESSPASFRKYLKDRFLAKVPPLKAVYLINGEADPVQECNRLNKIITENPVDVALVGIGENAHLAFNDPPADFTTTQPYIIVDLEEACRMQQYREGWFKSIDDVPRQAISMSVHQIMKSAHIICSVADSRKATAVKNSLEQPVSNLYPASILQKHPSCGFYMDEQAAQELNREVLVKN
ncbi:MAG TPA: glucosamine-6-phosphate deaminase [Chitinophaga sp.]|uniref:glucosamine-6-phosphate deaminase n=1 Tax=Chitinophaga sp. TaxID=1869181 RepID=UPI002C9CA003|nr:glucosamine-6-phosphate deaminase [Chitinophaga sp.]HVI43693.1 glucosamine-6-phosphate deaminase [Chitinophaga sp.]